MSLQKAIFCYFWTSNIDRKSELLKMNIRVLLKSNKAVYWNKTLAVQSILKRKALSNNLKREKPTIKINKFLQIMTLGKDKHQFISKSTEFLSTFSNIQLDQFFYISLILLIFLFNKNKRSNQYFEIFI